MSDLIKNLLNYNDVFSEHFVFSRQKMISENGLTVSYRVPKNNLKMDTTQYSSQGVIRSLTARNTDSFSVFNPIDCDGYHTNQKILIDEKGRSRFISPTIYLFEDEEYDISINGIKLDLFPKSKKQWTVVKSTDKVDLVPVFRNEDFDIDKIIPLNSDDNYELKINIKITQKSTVAVEEFIRDNGINLNKSFINTQFKIEMDHYKSAFYDRLQLLEYNYLKSIDSPLAVNHPATLRIKKFNIGSLYVIDKSQPMYFNELKAKATRMQSSFMPEPNQEFKLEELYAAFEAKLDQIKLSDVADTSQADVLLIIDSNEIHLYRLYRICLEMLKDANI